MEVHAGHRENAYLDFIDHAVVREYDLIHLSTQPRRQSHLCGAHEISRQRYISPQGA